MKWIFSILLLFSLSGFGQDDSAKYIWYKTQYGMRMPRIWADSVLKIPYRDTLGVTPNRGSLLLRPADGLIYRGNGVSWAAVGSGSGSVTNVATGYGLSGGPITVTGTLLVDSATLSTYYLRRKDSVLYVTQTKLNDTAAAIRAAIGGGGGATDITITHAATTATVNSSTGADGTINFAKTTLAGVLSPNAYDIGHLPEIKHYMAAKGLQAPNTHSVNYYPYSIDSVPYKFSTTRLGSNGHEYGGWLTPNLTGDSVQVRAPFCVVAGDSQAEGHPGRHGRLDPNGTSGFNAAYPDSTGQLSYHLRFLTNMRWVNHGIGGQTTTQLRRRFMRDIVGVPGTYSGDNKGNQTLWYKPQVAVIIIGINDVATGADIQLVKENFEWMASTLQQEGIRGVFLNLPGDEVMDSAFSYKIETINKWLNEGALDQYNATIVDYNSWWRDPTYNDNFHAGSLIVDDIHPSQVGYDSLANFIFRSAHLPVLKRAIFVNELDPGGFTGYSRPTGFTIGNAPGYTPTAYTIANSTDSVSITAPVWDSVWIKITASTNITGTTYTGFSSIYWYLENNIDTLRVTKRTTYNNGSQKPKSFFSNIKIVPPDFSAQKVIDVRLSDVTTNTAMEVWTDAGSGYMILNPLTSGGTRLNTSILSIYASGANAIGTNGSIIATGGTNQFGNFQLRNAAAANTTGYGISTAGTTYGQWYNTSSGGNLSHYLFDYWNTTPGSLGSTASGVTRNIKINLGFANAGNTDQRGFVIDMTPTYNVTTSFGASTQITGLRYAPTLTSLTGTLHRATNVTTGHNYFNSVDNNFGIGVDSNATIGAKLQVNGTTLFNSSSNAYAKSDGTKPYTSVIAGGGNSFSFAYTPTIAVYSKGEAYVVDTNNNVGIGAQMPSTAPGYANGTNLYANSNFFAGAAVYNKAENVTATGSLSLNQHRIYIDATAGAITLTLPAASSAFGNNVGIVYIFQRIDNSGNTITIQRAGSDTINGGTSFTLTTQWEMKEVHCRSSSAWAQY